VAGGGWLAAGPLTSHEPLATTMLFFGKKKRLIDYASCAG